MIANKQVKVFEIIVWVAWSIKNHGLSTAPFWPTESQAGTAECYFSDLPVTESPHHAQGAQQQSHCNWIAVNLGKHIKTNNQILKFQQNRKCSSF